MQITVEIPTHDEWIEQSSGVLPKDGSLDDVYQDDINALNTGVKALEAVKMFLEEAEK